MKKKFSITDEIALINTFFKSHRLPAYVPNNDTNVVRAGKSFVSLGVKLGDGARISSIEARLRELSEVISESRGEATPVRLRNLPLQLEIPHPERQPIMWDNPEVQPHAAALGKSFGYKGEQLELLDFEATPHVLISGTTGSGKSTLLQVLLTSLCQSTPPSELRLVLIDMKNEDLPPFAKLPHVQEVATTGESAARLLTWVRDEKDRRVASGGKKHQRIVLVIDELAELTSTLKEQNVKSSVFGSILAIGRSKSINVIAATQKPLASIVGSVAKSNFPLRLVGRVLSADDAKVAAGQSGTGAEYLPGKGSFLYVVGSEVRRFQSYLIPDIQRQAELVADRWMEQAALPWVPVGVLTNEER